MANLLAAMDEAIADTEATALEDLEVKPLKAAAKAPPPPPPQTEELVVDDDDELSDSDAEMSPKAAAAADAADDDEFDYEGETGTVAVEALPVAASEPTPEELEAKHREEEKERTRVEEERRRAAEQEAEQERLRAERAAAELASIRAAAATVEAGTDAVVRDEGGVGEAQVASQWDHVSHVATMADEVPADGTKKGFRKEKVAISFREALLWFEEANISEELKDIVVSDEHHMGFFEKFFSCLFATSLDASLVEERNRSFAYARMRYREGEAVHTRMLQTIFLRLTQTKLHVPLKGPHWEEIGCQGSDPSTDIRVPGVGMLGVLQIIWLLSNHGDIARWIHRASDKAQEPMSKFPFFVTAFQFTKTAVEAMRQGKLNGLFNQGGKGAVLEVLGKLFAGTFWTFAKLWDAQQLSIHKFDETYKQVDRDAKADPAGTIASFERAAGKFSGAQGGGGDLTFLNMEDKVNL